MITVVATFAMGEARRMTVLRKSTDAYRVIEERMGARGWRAWHRCPAPDTPLSIKATTKKPLRLRCATVAMRHTVASGGRSGEEGFEEID